MKTNQPKKIQENSFSGFALGVTVGVVAALLFGTDEGRKIVKETLNAIPEKYKKIPEDLISKIETKKETIKMPIIPVQETSHHTTYEFESPPPPPPTVHLTRPQ